MTQISPSIVSRSFGAESSPLVIGGNGGSGTRLVAEILIQAGLFMGYDLNRSSDNLLFTYLFKRPIRHAPYLKENKPRSDALFALHEKLFLRNARLTLKELGLVVQAGRDHVAGPYYGRRWILERWQKMMWLEKSVNFAKGWGWKEPHSMFFLRGVTGYYPQLKFILVLRDGLDMAFSKNVQQFRYWSFAYDIDGAQSSVENRFEFWYRSNLDVIRFGRTQMDANFLVLKFEDLCMKPKETISQLLQFAGLGVSDAPTSIWSLPELPASYGRYRQHNTSWISPEIKRKSVEIGYVH